tara:strand:+ start:410 stop:1510 length:1101 start_codon:yes stop_codon:yes gene_type:complete
MKILITGIILSLLAIGCAPQKIQPSFEDSNQFFIEKIIKQFEIGKELEGVISPKYKIALLSIEEIEAQDKPMISLIEDQIISSLIQDGFSLVERDTDAIYKLMRESDKKYSLLLKKPNGMSPYEEVNDTTVESEFVFYPTHLSSADVVVFYRVLEAGIIYRENEEDEDFEKREGLVRLHIRVQKVQTGEILHATTLTSKFSDQIRKEFKPQLESFHYSFFSFDYPLQNNEEKEWAVINSKSGFNVKNLNISPKIGMGFNGYSVGLIYGGSFNFSTYSIDYMAIPIPKRKTSSIMGYYKKPISNSIIVRGGIGSIKTKENSELGFGVGANLTLPFMNKFTLNPAFDLIIGSNNMLIGLNINLEMSKN